MAGSNDQQPPLLGPLGQSLNGTTPDYKIYATPTLRWQHEPKAYPWGNQPWPSSEGASDSPTVDREHLRTLAARMRTDLGRFTAGARDTDAAGNLSAADVGQWQAGTDLFSASQQSQQAIARMMNAFVTSYADLITRVATTAQVWDDTEDTNVTEIQKILKPAFGTTAAPGQESPVSPPATPPTTPDLNF